MADDKQTLTTEDHPTPEVSGPAEQPAAETATPEQAHDSADNVIPFGGAGAEHEEDNRQEWEKTSTELEAEQKKPRRGRPPKEAVEQTGPEGEKKPEKKSPRKGRPPKADKPAPDKTVKPVRDKVSQSKKAAAKETPPAPAPEQPPDPATIPRPVEEGQVVYLKLSELHAFHTFRDHPYKVQDDDKMKELVGTIREHGVMTPATVRPEKDGSGYEIRAVYHPASGHSL